jgi:hypothetical protein
MTAFGEQMARLMAERDMSLHRLARLASYDVGYLCKVKNGRKRPSAALAAQVDEVLGAGGVLISLAPAVPSRGQGRGDVPAARGTGAWCAAGRQQEVAEFRAVFPAAAGAVAGVRAYVRAVAGCGVLPGGLEVIASELASGAVRWQPGGVFTVTVRPGPGRVRVEVVTAGSGWWPGGDDDDESAYALGLVLVDGLADRFGHFGIAGGAAVLWAEVGAGAGR